MAAVFDFEAQQAQRCVDKAHARRAAGDAVGFATSVGGRAGLRLLNEFRGQIAAAESQILAAHVSGDGKTRDAERLLADGKTSKREARRKARRAKAVRDNDSIADKLGSGALSEEQADVIADAADRTNGAAASDSDLIDKIAAVPPEQGRAIADDFVASRTSASDVQTEHDRQRALRRASKYRSKLKGLDTISLEGDGIAIKAMWDAIAARADLLYRLDGNRELPLHKHPRTNEQRRFDAAHQIICGLDPQNAPDAGGASSGTSTRPRLVVNLTLDKFLGRDRASTAEQIGLGLIPDSVLADYAEHADIIAALFDSKGEPLWLRRLNRYATATQMVALVLRDKACVLCGADHTICQAHHIMPWNAPGKGNTNLDELVLLCPSCHSQLHDDKQTIYQDDHSGWRTRDALPHEIPRPRPVMKRSQRRHE